MQGFPSGLLQSRITAIFLMRSTRLARFIFFYLIEYGDIILSDQYRLSVRVNSFII
jgi:hypothetical protein